MNADTSQEAVTVDLHVRSLAPRAGHAQQNVAIERLDDLESADRIEAFNVHVWGHQISLSTAAANTDAGQFVLDRVEQFRSWAAETGRSVDSFFETRRVESEIMDEEYAALVLPSLTLAEYRDGDLAFVAPCSDDGSVCTVEDRIDVLAASGVTDVLQSDDPELPSAVVEEE
ncbi:HTH domain-containing protein [Halorientalis brevis]|uniref:HTH domain-containing protein n=1 Tax=Halorientalis brevis TaxID=1126241 RepID=A0ABD6C665_9EURY|nr:HTH domain-containing protein [Halorientalis brevis]